MNTSGKNYWHSCAVALATLLGSVGWAQAQVAGSPDGCVSGRFGIDAGLYSGVIEYGLGVEPATAPRSRDWFQGPAGAGLIDETLSGAIQNSLQTQANPLYEARQKFGKVGIQDDQVLIDAIFARDYFGGTGQVDLTSFTSASKNGQDPAIWAAGASNVLGKNDIIDVGGHMFRDGVTLEDDLWFVGALNLAEPGGTSYIDFEFYVEGLTLNNNQFSSGGPNLGHTAYSFQPDPANPGQHLVSKIGDFIFSVSLLSSGPVVETRVWVSRQDWQTITPTTFDWGGSFDGPFTGSPFGYASIVPKQAGIICGYVNQGNEAPAAPPWGTKTSKTNSYRTTYLANSLAEVSINLTSLGLDHSTLLGVDDTCFFPLNTFIAKTRASAAFTAALKDFAGPYTWADVDVEATVITAGQLSCNNPIAIIEATPSRTDLFYLWQTSDGVIANAVPLSPNYKEKHGLIVNAAGDTIAEVDGFPWNIEVSEPGTYAVKVILPTGCSASVGFSSASVGFDPAFPLFNGKPNLQFTLPCDGNNATVTATISGATAPYTYELYKNNVLEATLGPVANTSQTFTGLSAGTYRVDVKGLYACVVTSDDVVIPASTPLTFTETITPASCFGTTDGKIELGTVSGKAPLSYLWSTGNTSKDLLNRGAGTYALDITDGDGCVYNYNYTITQPTQITAVLNKTDDPGNAGGGTAEVIPSGGTGPYTFSWAKTGDAGFSATTAAVTNLGYGAYTVTVTDATNCSRSFSTFIFEQEICNDGIDNDGNGQADCLDNVCIPAATASIATLPIEPCVGETVTYTADPVAGATAYVWTVPANATIVGGQNTAVLEVQWQNTNGGQICVRAQTAAGCFSPATCITENIQDSPTGASVIQLNNN